MSERHHLFNNNEGYPRRVIDAPLFKKYAFSHDGCFLSVINQDNKFALYSLDDVASGILRPFYTDKNYAVDAFAFTNFDLLQFESSQIDNFTAGKVHPPLNLNKIARKFDKNNAQLILATESSNDDKNNNNNIQSHLRVFDISTLSFIADIIVPNQISQIKSDKIFSSKIYYIEKVTNNLISYDFISKKREFITKNTEFFEELENGSLLISTKEGMKYYEFQSTLKSLSPKGLNPLAFFPLAYQKVLLIGSIYSPSPMFMVFDPLSDKLEPVYNLPYFNCKENSFSAVPYGFYGNSAFIASNTSKYLVFMKKEDEFYTINDYCRLDTITYAMHYAEKDSTLILFGDKQITLFQIEPFHKQHSFHHRKIYSIQENKKDENIEKADDSEMFENEKLREINERIKNLPQPSNPMNAVNFLKKETGSVLNSISNLNDLLKEQIIAIKLSEELANKKPWDPSDAEYYTNKIQGSLIAAQRKFKNAQSNLHGGNGMKQFAFRYSMQTSDSGRNSSQQQSQTPSASMLSPNPKGHLKSQNRK
ncbi:hypothetical protein TRFO_40910 [Tritrichomonas foetus]|uniref:Uncharacterized protein n=1 Tax=Tritrichomonas foetus TaxID=1144522 RepID=A0A1J4IZE8_9EUKA|nr:hypothetical protein TRFO_40910 [Tritrichomonas foetus]|eukprot:OHS92790.1 hypothetical protein TRFO_40910 [Tritrichomonas foetus]